MDLNQIVMDSFKNIQASGRIEEMVEKTLTKTLESIIDDMFRSYSDFGKQLKEQVKSQIEVNLGELNFTHYNQIVLAIVKEKLDETMRVYGAEQMKQQMDELLGTAKPEWKLSELIEEMKKRELAHNDELRDSEISLHVERSSGLIWIYFDPKSGKTKYQCHYSIFIDKDDNVSRVSFKDKDISKPSDLMGRLYGFEQIAFQLYAAGSKLIVDEEDVDTYYPEEDYD